MTLSTTMKYYLSGPMKGYDNSNYPAFEAACKELRQCGYEVFSPHEMGPPYDPGEETAGGKTKGQLLGEDIQIIVDTINGIIFLPGWENSTGARLEAYSGLLKNIPFFEYTHTPDEGVVLEEVPQRLVAGVCAAEWCPKETLEKLGLL